MGTAQTVLRLAVITAVLVVGFYIGQPVVWELQAQWQEFREGGSLSDKGEIVLAVFVKGSLSELRLNLRTLSCFTATPSLFLSE